MQDGKQPGLDLGKVPQLVALRRKNIERLLSKIAGVGLCSRQTQGEPVKRRVMPGHYLFKG